MRTDKIKGGLRLLALALILTALIPNKTAAQVAGSSSCPASGPAGVGALHREWILVGWEKQVGDGPFIFREKLGKYYDFSAHDVVLYDDFDPQKRVAHSAEEYVVGGVLARAIPRVASEAASQQGAEEEEGEDAARPATHRVRLLADAVLSRHVGGMTPSPGHAP